MDVSPNTIREVEFREKLRGYNQDDVDEFLERVAAGLEILQERLREATERALRAEQQAREVFDGDDSLRRTLGLAQRTADLAVQEARDQAARIIEAAHAQGLAMAEEARDQARRLAEEAQSQIWADVGRLEASREQLRQDVAALARYLETEREKVESSLLEAAANLRQAVPGASPPPALHQLDLNSIKTWGSPAAEPPRALGEEASDEPDESGSSQEDDQAETASMQQSW
ncbi:MAG TPA: DivIVA domain-containing protein [Acidimicrobiales bacterium]|nr:DivIVA domain-containing protein [Acidimicrobiales bacterium]